jgi:D-alanyl-D-alanine carboxypeptidase
MIKTFLTTFLIIAISQIGFAQTNFDTVKLNEYFNTIEENNKFMGSVAISKNGEVIYSKAIGFADIEKRLKASEKTKYRIGSITKTFTTVLVLKANEEVVSRN